MISFLVCFVVGVTINLIGLLIFFTSWTNLIGIYPGRVALDAEGRPSEEYVERDGKRWFPPFVAASYLPELSPIWGNLRLLRLRYWGTSFTVDALKEASTSQAGSPFPALEIGPAQLDDPNRKFDKWLLSSAHFWLWETLTGKPREENGRYSRYALSLGMRGDYYLASENLERALTCFLQLRELMPDSVVPPVKLSQAQLQKGTPQEAEHTLLDFLSRHPREAPARLMLAYLYETVGKQQQALTQYTIFRANHPEHESLPYVEQRIALLSAPALR